MKRNFATSLTDASRHLFRMAALAAVLFALTAGAADPLVQLGGLFADNMVIERTPRNKDRPFLWGWAAKGVEISINLGDTNQPKIRADWPFREIPATNSFHHSWAVTYGMLRDLPEGAFNINIFSKLGRKEAPEGALHNVVMGEVWLLVDPETGVKADLGAHDSGAMAADIRLLNLAMPAAANLSGWQVLSEPQASLPDQLSVASYWLARMSVAMSRQPLGVLLVREAQMRPYIPQNDFRNLPEIIQRNPVYSQPFDAWRNAWERAAAEWKDKQEMFQQAVILHKRRGEPVGPETSRNVPLGQPSLDKGDIPNAEIQNLHIELRGVLH